VIAHEEVAPRYTLEIVGKIEVDGDQQRERILEETLLWQDRRGA
jgi:hypothetical protein